jgi:hypothetical protein
MRRKDRRSPERSRGNRGVAELRAEALGTGPMGRDIQDLGYELPRNHESGSSTSENTVKAKFAEFSECEVGRIRARKGMWGAS